jgi:hypothetical protein
VGGRETCESSRMCIVGAAQGGAGRGVRSVQHALARRGAGAVRSGPVSLPVPEGTRTRVKREVKRSILYTPAIICIKKSLLATRYTLHATRYTGPARRNAQ